jgi:hypothetical protein
MALDLQFKVETKDPDKWLAEATAKAKKLAGTDDAYIGADVFVFLPERGRCFTKKAGSLRMVAHG